MTQIIWRSLLAFSLGLALSACQTPVTPSHEPAIDEFAVAELVFTTYVDSRELLMAGQQLEDLQADYPEDERIVDLQQRLATAWLNAGQQALQNADVLTASTALMQAKRLLPQAPALTEGLSAALAEVQAQAQVEAEQSVIKPPVKRPTVIKPSKPAVQKTANNPAQSAPPLTVTEPVIEPVTKSLVTPPLPEKQPVNQSKFSGKKARTLDLNAEQTTLALPMLANRNDHQLGRLLDDVAADVVMFRATVTIEVADTRDFHWVATLLSARVKKLDANFKPRLQEVIRSDGRAQLVITPNKSL